MEEKIANFKGKRMIRKAEALNCNWTSSAGGFSNGELVLLDNVQFIYELALAWLELQSLEADFEMTNGLREFRLTKAKDEEKLRRRLAYFKLVMGKFTDYFYIIQKKTERILSINILRIGYIRIRGSSILKW